MSLWICPTPRQCSNLYEKSFWKTRLIGCQNATPLIEEKDTFESPPERESTSNGTWDSKYHLRKVGAKILNLQITQSIIQNKTRTSKVGAAISNAQRVQNIFFRKKMKFSKKFFFPKTSHSAEKKSKGGPFSFGRFCRLRLKSRKWKGGPFGEKIFSKKKSHSAGKKS